MDRDRNRKYANEPLRTKRYSGSSATRSNYLKNSNNQPKEEIQNNNSLHSKPNDSANKNSGQLKPFKYTDFPLPNKRKIKLPTIKINLTYRKIMMALAVLLLITFSANLILFYNYRKNHPAQAKIVLQEDTGKGIEIDEYGSYDKTPVTASVVNGYTAEKDIPKLLQIQKINLNSRIKIVSSDSSGSIKVPKNINDVGWYEGSSKPADRGVVFLDGTTVYDGTQGVFANINRLVPGDDIVIIMGDGTEYKYTVKKTKTIDAKNFNILTSIDPPEIKGQGLSITVNYGPADDPFQKRYIVLADKQ